MPACCPFTHNTSLIKDVEDYLYCFLEDQTDDPEEIFIWKEEVRPIF